MAHPFFFDFAARLPAPPGREEIAAGLALCRAFAASCLRIAGLKSESAYRLLPKNERRMIEAQARFETARRSAAAMPDPDAGGPAAQAPAAVGEESSPVRAQTGGENPQVAALIEEMEPMPFPESAAADEDAARERLLEDWFQSVMNGSDWRLMADARARYEKHAGIASPFEPVGNLLSSLPGREI